MTEQTFACFHFIMRKDMKTMKTGIIFGLNCMQICYKKHFGNFSGISLIYFIIKLFQLRYNY